jgi:hypothetical protein
MEPEMAKLKSAVELLHSDIHDLEGRLTTGILSPRQPDAAYDPSRSVFVLAPNASRLSSKKTLTRPKGSVLSYFRDPPKIELVLSDTRSDLLIS